MGRQVVQDPQHVGLAGGGVDVVFGKDGGNNLFDRNWVLNDPPNAGADWVQAIVNAIAQAENCEIVSNLARNLVGNSDDTRSDFDRHKKPPILQISMDFAIRTRHPREGGAADPITTANEQRCICIWKTFAANEISRLVTLEHRDNLAGIRDYDVLVGNLLTNVLLRMAAEMRSAVVPGGILIGGCFVMPRAGDAEEAFKKIGLEIVDGAKEDIWEAGVFRVR